MRKLSKENFFLVLNGIILNFSSIAGEPFEKNEEKRKE